MGGQNWWLWICNKEKGMSFSPRNNDLHCARNVAFLNLQLRSDWHMGIRSIVIHHALWNSHVSNFFNKRLTLFSFCLKWRRILWSHVMINRLINKQGSYQSYKVYTKAKPFRKTKSHPNLVALVFDKQALLGDVLNSNLPSWRRVWRDPANLWRRVWEKALKKINRLFR